VDENTVHVGHPGRDGFRLGHDRQSSRRTRHETGGVGNVPSRLPVVQDAGGSGTEE
jgi:hypothetical protein